MSNPLTTKTKEALWDDRQDLDPDMAALYAINAQAGLNRLAVAQGLDQLRMARVHSLYVRYRALSLQREGSVATSTSHPELSGPSTGVGSQSASVASTTTNQDAHMSAGHKSAVSQDSNGPPDTRDGIPRCFNHRHNRRATYHLPSECRALKKPRVARNIEEGRRQEEQVQQQLASNPNNNQANLRSHTNNAQIDCYPHTDYRPHLYHRAPGHERGQNRHQSLRSLSPRSSRRYRP